MDDGAFVFNNRKDLEKGSLIAFTQMKRLGLNMHVGVGNKTSKTEAMYIPSRSIIKSWINDHEKHLLFQSNLPAFDPLAKKKRKPSFKQMSRIIETYYDRSPKTKKYFLEEHGFISFTKLFKYLGSWISFDLSDEFDIEERIKSANKAMGALRFYWKSKQVDLHSKYLIYQAIPINLLLWGCESWALTKVLISKLEVFHNRCIRSILQIKWDEVREFKITNVQIRKKFHNIDSIENQVSKRRLHFLGKVIRMPCKKIPARLISAFMKNSRPQGRPNNTIRHSFLNDISKIIPNIDQFGSFNTWTHVAHNIIHWSFLVNNLHTFEPEPCDTDTTPKIILIGIVRALKVLLSPNHLLLLPLRPLLLSLHALHSLMILIKFWE